MLTPTPHSNADNRKNGSVPPADDTDGKSNLHSDPAEVAADRETLIAFYLATGGDRWRDNTHWLAAAPLGQWHGVQTCPDGAVANLYRNDNGLSGHIPADIGGSCGTSKTATWKRWACPTGNSYSRRGAQSPGIAPNNPPPQPIPERSEQNGNATNDNFDTVLGHCQCNLRL